MAQPPTYLKVLKEDHFVITYLHFQKDSVRAVCECFAPYAFSGTYKQVSDSTYLIYLSDDKKNRFRFILVKHSAECWYSYAEKSPKKRNTYCADDGRFLDPYNERKKQIKCDCDD
jgi:hypothetical protein